MNPAINLKGQRFGRLVVIEQVEPIGKSTSAHWSCLCDCGNYNIVHQSNLRRKKGIKSCGCLRDEMMGNLSRKEPGRAGFTNLINKYRKNAKKNNRQFELTEDQLKSFFQQECYYCGSFPVKKSFGRDIFKNEKSKQHTLFMFNGIDRVDNSKGYTLDNCVSCCEQCNRMKLTYTKEEFLNKVMKIAERFKCV